MTSKLRNYIRHGEVPVDIEYYADNALEMCPLCDEDHYGYTEHAFEVPGDGWSPSSIISAYICEKCHYEVQNEHAEASFNTMPEALENYILHGKFPDNAQAFTTLPHFCVFCRGDVESVYMQLDLPIGEKSIGGVVNACESCADKYGWVAKEQITENCKKCGTNYPITAEEHITRYKTGTENKHYCSGCADDEHGHFTVANRYTNTMCSVCGCSLLADKMLLSKSNMADARCGDHVDHVHIDTSKGNKYTLHVLYHKELPDYRIVITDRVSSIHISYQKLDSSTEFYYKVLDHKYILPSTVRHADLAIQALTHLNELVDEDN